MTTMKFPKTVGACVDQLYALREERLALGRRLDEMKQHEAALEEHIFQQFDKQELAGAKGAVAVAAVKTQVTVTLTDWDAFLEGVKKAKAWDMLRRQPASKAVLERWDAGKTVPGVEPFTKVSLSLTKVR